MELDNLKELAEDVKGWGNCNRAWTDYSEDGYVALVGHISEDGEMYPVTTVDCSQYYEPQDSIKLARFYAAINPEAVLELIEQLTGATRWRNAVDEPPQEAKEVLFVHGGKTVHGAWIGGAFWHNNKRCSTAAWFPLPAPPKSYVGGTAKHSEERSLPCDVPDCGLGT